MPTKGSYHGNYISPQTFAHLDKFAGGARGLKQMFLYPLAHGSVVYLFDDFWQDTFATDPWTTNGGTGATAFAIPATPIVGGAAQGATGTNATASNRRVNLYGAPVWSGDKNCGIEVRFRSSRVSDLIFEIGFIDTMTSITTAAPAVTDVDTPSFAAGLGDAAVVVMDTGQTLTTMALACIGSGSLNAGSATAIGTLAPAINTWMKVRVQLYANEGSSSGNNAVAWIDDSYGNHVTKTAGIEGGTLVRPWVFIGGGSTTTCTVDLDYIRVWQDR